MSINMLEEAIVKIAQIPEGKSELSLEIDSCQSDDEYSNPMTPSFSKRSTSKWRKEEVCM